MIVVLSLAAPGMYVAASVALMIDGHHDPSLARTLFNVSAFGLDQSPHDTNTVTQHLTFVNLIIKNRRKVHTVTAACGPEYQMYCCCSLSTTLELKEGRNSRNCFCSAVPDTTKHFRACSLFKSVLCRGRPVIHYPYQLLLTPAGATLPWNCNRNRSPVSSSCLVYVD